MSIEQKLQMYINHAEERMNHFKYNPRYEDEYRRWSRTRTNLITRLREVEQGSWSELRSR